jgi:hypothetical protein
MRRNKRVVTRTAGFDCGERGCNGNKNNKNNRKIRTTTTTTARITARITARTTARTTTRTTTTTCQGELHEGTEAWEEGQYPRGEGAPAA